MRRFYEFQCSEHGVFEKFTEYTKQIACPTCGKLADKIISTPQISLEGYSGDFPGAAMTFDRKHRQKLADERKKLNS